MDRVILDLFHEYRHEPMPRRVFLERLAELAGGAAAALTLLPLLEGRRGDGSPHRPGRPET
jgi:carboxymethylenebutenolidase